MLENTQYIGSSQPDKYNFYLNKAQDSDMDSCLDDIKEVIIENGGSQGIETLQNSGFSKVLDSAGEMKHPNVSGVVTKDEDNTEESITNQAPSSCSDGFSPPNKKIMQTELSASENRIATYCCKACGKIFNDIHKLKRHMQKK